MIAKIAVLFAVVAVAYAGVIGVASPPASTALLANVAPVVHAPVAYSAIAAAPVVQAYAAAPAVHHVAAPITYAAAPTIVQTGTKVVHTYEPVEQHGYKIVY